MWPPIPEKISEMSGMGRKMPFTFGAFAIASLSMIGVPLVCGFVTKWYLAIGAMQAHQICIFSRLIGQHPIEHGLFFPGNHSGLFRQG